jgi:hypothetical protein
MSYRTLTGDWQNPRTAREWTMRAVVDGLPPGVRRTSQDLKAWVAAYSGASLGLFDEAVRALRNLKMPVMCTYGPNAEWWIGPTPAEVTSYSTREIHGFYSSLVKEVHMWNGVLAVAHDPDVFDTKEMALQHAIALGRHPAVAKSTVDVLVDCGEVTVVP